MNAATCELCAIAMDTMIAAYGSEAGVVALKWMPFSGLYIAGGIAPKNLERIKSAPFMAAFHDKGRVSGFLKRIPVHVVLDENLGQRGAHLIAYNSLLKQWRRKESLLFEKTKKATSDSKKANEKKKSLLSSLPFVDRISHVTVEEWEATGKLNGHFCG